LTRHNESSIDDTTEDFLNNYQVIFENAPDGISVFDADGYLLWCNSAALDIYGYSNQEEVIGTSYNTYIHPDCREEEIEIFQRIKAGENIPLHDAAFGCFRKDGTTFPAHVRSTPIFMDGKFIGFHSHTRNVSKLKDTENRLRSSLSAVDLLASLIHHDFRNDFQVVESALDAALMVMDEKTMTTEFLSIAKSGLHRMRSLLMLIAPAGSMEAEHLEGLLEERIKHTKEMHPDLKITLLKPDSLTSEIASDRRLLAFVFDNLFRNSVKYAGPASTIVVKIEQDNGTIQIDIVDDGPGVSESVKDTLFQRGVTTSGSGFGLFICNRIIEGDGGKIDLLESSTLGTGAAFRITLPLNAQNESN